MYNVYLVKMAKSGVFQNPHPSTPWALYGNGRQQILGDITFHLKFLQQTVSFVVQLQLHTVHIQICSDFKNSLCVIIIIIASLSEAQPFLVNMVLHKFEGPVGNLNPAPRIQNLGILETSGPKEL